MEGDVCKGGREYDSNVWRVLKSKNSHKKQNGREADVRCEWDTSKGKEREVRIINIGYQREGLRR